MTETSEPSTAAAEPRPLILLGDGSWCGRETDTKSNIYLLAKMVGIDIDNVNDTDVHDMGDRAWYIHGVGLGSTFLDYVFNGITAQDIAMQCITAYKFIVDHYTYPDRQIWMFGLSRGAYMVRSVAGMINNCGIVKQVNNPDGSVNEEETKLLCQQVYRIYRSDDPINDPHSTESVKFRQKASWPLIGDEEEKGPRLLPPVKFLGLFDTIGSLGIPDFVGGVGLDWPQFHDQNVSTVVDLVYHAVSLHDDFYIFPPCLAKRKKHEDKSDDFGITQQWFPGVHYDLGRQRFRFFRMFGGGLLERLLARWMWANKVIEPNEVLSDLVLKWMLEAIRKNDPSGQVITTTRVDQEIAAAKRKISSPSRRTGHGDVYKNIIEYGPFGKAIVGILTTLSGDRWRTNQIYQLFFALRDRLIADPNARVYDYMEADASIPEAHGLTVEQLAGIDRARYPSQTYQAWRLCNRLPSQGSNIGPGTGGN
ncbi:hypothetical protein B0T10DRAFT_515996 [Thelonectria olida]|uniref:T6SS Phospholipase effector Tle1-like catalytic domain-containing protein n=1 Tax=Thelonectria olida TaxID=1576542 RepID=A0A9P8W246_9HYPO|nr:hypothetical protein B0T10DRAFT_515996 [Thelonectria olida]